MSYSYKSVEPFTGDWSFASGAAAQGRYEPKGDLGLTYSRSALAISEAGGRYFGARDEEAVTFLIRQADIPRPDNDNEILRLRPFQRTLRMIGYQIMKYGDLAEAQRRGLIVMAGALATPQVVFEATDMRDIEAIKHEAYPNGPGYATVHREDWKEGFELGWCDPTNGRGDQVEIDVAAIRQEYPGLRPVVKVPIWEGGL